MSRAGEFRWGRAAPRAGWVSRLDPRARLLVLLVLLLGIPMAGSPAALVALLLAGLGLPRALGLPRGFTRSLLRLAALPLIFTLLVNAAYGPGAGLAPKPSLAGLAAGGLRALQLWLTWMCFSLFWAVTSPDELLRALRVSGAGGPRGWQDFTLTVELALRMMPLVGEEAERVVLAQSARGMEWGGNLARRAGQALALAVPVLHSALRRAEALADLLVARGFGSGPATSAVGYRWAWRDTGAVLAAAGLMAGLALLGRPA